MRSRVFFRLVQIALALAMLSAAVLKFVHEYQPGTLLPLPAYYGSAVAELLLAGLLLVPRYAGLGAIGVVLLAVGGLVVVWIQGDGQLCGCLGKVQMTKWEHILVLGLLGTGGTLALLGGATPRRQDR